MISNEFQVEPDISSGLSATDRTQLTNWFKNERIETSISSMLLSLLLHGKLTDSEKNLLALLAPADTIIFILDRDQYIYPDETTDLPKEFIEIGLDQSHNALFTQNCSRTRNNRRKIHSARIGKDNRHDIILGFVHSDDGSQTVSVYSKFSELVTLFRKCWNDASTGADSLVYKSNLPQITVNQTSGRVVMINQEMANLLKKDIFELVGCEYFEIRQKLTELPNSSHIRLKQKSIGSLRLAEFALTSDEHTTKNNVEKHELLRFLMHGIRNKLTAISSATEQIQDYSKTDELSDELLEIIGLATDQLGTHLNQLDLIYHYHRFQKEDCSLINSIKDGITQALEMHPDRGIELIDYAAISDMTLNLPEGSLTTLIYALLNAQIETGTEYGNTHIALVSNQDYSIIKITTNKITSEDIKRDSSDWLSYSHRLADLMSLTIKNDYNNNAQTAVIELHIPNRG